MEGTTSGIKSFFARSFRSSKTHHEKNGKDERNGKAPASKNRLWLTTLYTPGPDQKPVADIIFVHGLNGRSFSTWCKGNDPECYWPQRWLPEDDGFKDVRIHAFGYPAAATRESVLNIRDIARSLLAAVHDSPVMNKEKELPLIFVAHSMGGLVVKQAYLLGRREAQFKPVADRVCSIFFLATPHQGAGIAQALSRLTKVIGTRPFVEDLFPGSSLIQSLTEDFPQVCGDLQLFSFYETLPMSAGIHKMLIVDKASAVLNLPNERRTFLEANHRNVAMYSTREDPAYVSVRDALATVIASQRNMRQAEAHDLTKSVSREDRAALGRFLGVSDAPEDDLMTQRSARLPGSCEWLVNKKCYYVWKESREPSFLWLQGRPGAGKSVLSGHVVETLRNQGLDCCFFFFQARDSIKSSVNSCLRSLAWQMAMLHPSVLEQLKTLMSEWKENSSNMDNKKMESQSVWQRIFLSGILKVPLSRPQFWVIDAMDECTAPGDMTAFLTRMQERWPLFVLVTSRDAVEMHQHGASPNVDIWSYTITEQDSLQDISLLLEANLPYLPCPASERWPTPAALSSEILERSAGCFLWASLICSELRQVTSEREMTEVLNTTPSDMDALYCDILARMEKARFGKQTTKAILAWATYAFRPLHLAEMQTSIELDIDDKITDIRRVIARCCGSLMFVDKHHKVQLVHLTAREFLTRGGEAQSELTLAKSDGHRRLASGCLRLLLQLPEKRSAKSKRIESAPGTNTPPIFVDYASKFLFEHMERVDSGYDELIMLLRTFLTSSRVLDWIEYIAANGDLRTIYQAGKAIQTISSHKIRDGSWDVRVKSIVAIEDTKLLMEGWAQDLCHLVFQFGARLRSSPNAIHRHIAPFCPTFSAMRAQFSGPQRGLSTNGFAFYYWDHRLASICYPRGKSALTVAAGQGYFAVGTGAKDGQVLVYDDAIFQEVQTVYHDETGKSGWVRYLAFSRNGKYLATGGHTAVRVWSPANGLELASFKLPARCVCMTFAEENKVLRVATERNLLVEWDLESNTFVDSEPVSWDAHLPERMRGRILWKGWLSPHNNLLAAVYRGHDLVFWDCAERRLHDIYEPQTGSVQRFGSHDQAKGWVTVDQATFGQGAGSSLFAAIFGTRELTVFDLEEGKPIAVNTEYIYSSCLASSHDGQTLGAMDDTGNLALFEFRTLRLLYRAKSPSFALGPPFNLAFTSEDTRVVEIQDGQCHIQEPDILQPVVRHNHLLRPAAPRLTNPKDLFRIRNAKDAKEITAMTYSHELNAVFWATRERSVFVIELSLPESRPWLLFDYKSDHDIISLAFDEQAKILAYGERWKKFHARTVLRRFGPLEEARDAWEASSPWTGYILKSNSEGARLNQVLVSSRHQRLFVSTEQADTLWAIPQQAGGDLGEPIHRISHADDSTSNRWMTRTSPHQAEDHLLKIENTGQEVSIHDWTTLARLRVITLSPGPSLSLHHFAPLPFHPNYFITYARTTTGPKAMSAGKRTVAIQLWSYHDLLPASLVSESESNKLDSEPNPSPSPSLTPLWTIPRSEPPHQIEHVVGVCAGGTRLVCYTTDNWFASLELPPLKPAVSRPAPPGTVHSSINSNSISNTNTNTRSNTTTATGNSLVDSASFVRHIFLPDHWVSELMTPPDEVHFFLGKAGEIILGRRGEPAVIRRGLELMEDGGTFPLQLWAAGG